MGYLDSTIFSISGGGEAMVSRYGKQESTALEYACIHSPIEAIHTGVLCGLYSICIGHKDKYFIPTLGTQLYKGMWYN